MTTPPPSPPRSGVPAWLALVVVAAVYAGAPMAGFVWDDQSLYLGNHAVSVPSWEKIWMRDLWCCSGGAASGYYRPLITLSFVLDRSLFGLSSVGPHLHSLAWHLLVVHLTRLLLLERVGPARAWTAALIFGLHPIQSEAVLFLSARSELVMAAGVVGTLLAVDRRRLPLAACVALLACLAKETAYLLVLVVPLWQYAWGGRWSRRAQLWIVAGLLVALLLRSRAELGDAAVAAVAQLNPLSALYAVVRTTSWWLVPWPLSATWILSDQPPSITTWLSALAGGGLALFLVLRGGPRPLALLAISAILLAPSALAVWGYGLVGERYLYVGMLGVVATIVAELPRPRADWVFAGWLVPWVAGALGIIFVRAPDWASTQSLFRSAVERAPSGVSWNHYAGALMGDGEDAAALHAFEQSLAGTQPSLVPCRHVVEVAERLLDDDDFRRRTGAWRELGCGGGPIFDGSLALAYVRRGWWQEAAVLLENRESQPNRQPDDARRVEVVAALFSARDGDLLGYGAIWLDWPRRRLALLDVVAGVLQAR